jgi:dTDP-D-glucose 4,6-dehydratase
MLSVLINTNLLRSCLKNKVKKYFFSSSACAYNTQLQNDPGILGLKEEDAYPAMPEDGYGWEKLFGERMCRHFFEDYGLETRVARFHNVYGPLGTFDGGREKAPAALCRKVLEAKVNQTNEIEVWGDGNQTRSFLYINDCIDALPILAVLACFVSKPSVIRGASIARCKESDRISVMASQLRKMGAKIKEYPDGLEINPTPLKSAQVHSHRDHRIAMSLAIAGMNAQLKVIEDDKNRNFKQKEVIDKFKPTKE